jgi:hypothetical protein
MTGEDDQNGVNVNRLIFLEGTRPISQIGPDASLL